VIAGLVLSLAVSTALGLLLLRLVWPADVASLPRPLGLALAVGVGAGVSACALFLWLLLSGSARAFPVAEIGLLALAAAAAGRAARPRSLRAAAGVTPGWRGATLPVLAAAFLITLIAATAAFVSLLRREPHGQWDAWMNWDMRARMIFLGGSGWRTAFSPEIPWSHPDYPVLVPLLVVRSWLYAGADTLAGPALVAAMFAAGAVALLTSALAALRRPSLGLMAGTLLLATPFFIRHATALYADVPLSFFFLATVVCLALDGRYGSATPRFAAFAGLAAGLAMWTKNEGLLFTLAVVAGLLAAGRREGPGVARRRLLAFGAGLAPLLVLVMGFKVAFAPPNDLLSTLGLERTIGRLTDPDRYLTVLRAYAAHLATFGSNGLGGALWPLAVCVAALGLSRAESGRPWARAVALALGLLLAGHFMVFVSMADELSRLLRSSLDRLLLQIWPGALFLCFMVSRTLEELQGERSTTGPPIADPAPSPERRP
jgi:hypothetical protein